ncbi:hypothetical protein AA0616_1446 [Komagataeibacter nataicola NRIC 0616]|nr:hypothetical protein AA0616_1446 [Komagataeibacter nataicola NRIC 0616]
MKARMQARVVPGRAALHPDRSAALPRMAAPTTAWQALAATAMAAGMTIIPT